MTNAKAIADHWGKGDVYGLIVSALEKMAKPIEGLTLEDLTPVDHFHARGFPATVELADRLPTKAGQHILDIGCGLGGPARYIARRFQCTVSGIDITPPFVDAANKLTALLRMDQQVKIEHGDGQRLPYPGPKGNPHHPVPWSADGSGAYLIKPSETRALLEKTGFEDIVIEDTGAKYVAGYKMTIEKAERGALPPLGVHILMGETALRKTQFRAKHRRRPNSYNTIALSEAVNIGTQPDG